MVRENCSPPPVKLALSESLCYNNASLNETENAFAVRRSDGFAVRLRQ